MPKNDFALTKSCCSIYSQSLLIICNLLLKGSAKNFEQQRERENSFPAKSKNTLCSDLIPIPVLNAPPCVPREQNAFIKCTLNLLCPMGKKDPKTFREGNQRMAHFSILSPDLQPIV